MIQKPDKTPVFPLSLANQGPPILVEICMWNTTGQN